MESRSYERDIKVLGIAGSLREGSLNRRLLRAARELAPDGVTIDIFDLHEIPLYNADLDNDEERPAAVERLKQSIAEADALLIATPEYNHSIPGVLQNAIDWASRPSGRSPLAGKPVAIVGASPGAIGTARAQQQLKLVLQATLSYLMPHPGVLVNHANQKIDEESRITDARTRIFVERFLEQLAGWTRRMVPIDEVGVEA